MEAPHKQLSQCVDRVDKLCVLSLHAFQLFACAIFRQLPLRRLLGQLVLCCIRRDRGLVLHHIARDPEQRGDQERDCYGVRR